MIEAVFEDMEVKLGVFRELDRVAKPGAILATNTSTLDLNRIAAVTQRPQDVIGMHFFSPANVMKLLEVVCGAKTADDVLLTVMRLAKKIGKTAVISGVCDGFIGNRMLEQYLRQAMFLLDEGASPAQVDQALSASAWRWGRSHERPRGQRRGLVHPQRRFVEATVVTRGSPTGRELGRFSQKPASAGTATSLPRALPDQSMSLIADYRKERGFTRKSADEIVIAASTRWSTGRAALGKASLARLRHRRRLSRRLRLRISRRPMLRRYGRL